MRGLVAATVVLCSSGCADAFVAHADLVATIEGSSLRVERLAEMFAAAPDIPVEPAVVELLARHWVEYQAFVKRLYAGQRFLDSNLVREAMWPQVRQAVVDSFHTILIDNGINVAPASVDSAYRAGNMRFVNHILRAVTTDMPAEQKAAQRQRAEQIRNRLLAGASWLEVAGENEDELSKDRNGVLGVVERGQTVPRFENAVFALAPGDLSPVVETTAGFHVIFRPQLAQVRTAFGAAVRAEMVGRSDSIYEQELIVAKGIEVRPNTPSVLREIAANPRRTLARDRVLATYQGGEFSVSDFVRWMPVLPTQMLERIGTAPDEQLTQLARSLVVQEIIWWQADSAGIDLTPEMFGVIQNGLANQLQDVITALRIDHPDSLTNAPYEELRRLGDIQVDVYVASALANPGQAPAVPPTLAGILLREAEWEIIDAGVARVVSRATDLRRASGLTISGDGSNE